MVCHKMRRLAGSGRQSILGWCSTWWIVCCNRCMLYSVYAVLGVNCWSWHREIESNDWTSCWQVMVELRMRQREMRGYGGNNYEKLELKRIPCASEFTIPDMAGMSPDPVCIYTNTRTSQPNQVCLTPDFWYRLISSTSFSSSSPICLFLVHNSTIITEHKVKSSLSISLCHDHELTLSTAYTKYSIHQVQHTPSTAYTKYSMHPRLCIFHSFSWVRVDHWM